MKEQKLKDFINIENFINEVTIKLNEKYKVYPSIKIGKQTIKSKDGYFTSEGIEKCLNEILYQQEAKQGK